MQLPVRWKVSRDWLLAKCEIWHQKERLSTRHAIEMPSWKCIHTGNVMQGKRSWWSILVVIDSFQNAKYRTRQLDSQDTIEHCITFKQKTRAGFKAYRQFFMFNFICGVFTIWIQRTFQLTYILYDLSREMSATVPLFALRPMLKYVNIFTLAQKGGHSFGRLKMVLPLMAYMITDLLNSREQIWSAG